MRTDVGGRKRLKLFVLVCAYLDAGEPSPAVRTLASTLKVNWQAVDALLKQLERDGFLEIAWQQGRDRRNVYRIGKRGRA
jgi:DNA-binding transcriptional regulator YhcF (GntR family)